MSDLGWLPGPSYVVYGPLCNGGTSVLFESTATYPDYGKSDIDVSYYTSQYSYVNV